MRMIPMVIGALGVISEHFHSYIKQLDLQSLNQYILQKIYSGNCFEEGSPRDPQHGCNLVHLACNPSNLCNLHS